MNLIWKQKSYGTYILVDVDPTDAPNKVDLKVDKAGVPKLLRIWQEAIPVRWVDCTGRCPCTGEEEVKEWAKRTYLMEFALWT